MSKFETATTLEDLLLKVRDQGARNQDYIWHSANLAVEGGADNTTLIIEQAGGVPTQKLHTNSLAFDQINQSLNIDVRTGRYLRETTPDQYHAMVQAQLGHHNRNKLLRTRVQADGSLELRAMLSDKYKTFDHTDMLTSTLPQLIESDAQWELVRGDITERAMHISMKSRVHTGEPAVGDLMALGIRLRNSETGCGSVEISQLIWTLACLNGMQTGNTNRNAHLTSARAESDTWEILTSEAKQADNQALSLKLRDVVVSYASRESFDQVLEQMESAHNDPVANPMAAVSQIQKQFQQVTKKDTDLIMNGLMQTLQQSGYNNRSGVSRAALVNAITAVAHQKDPDDRPIWEKLGGQILTLNRSQWDRIGNAQLVAA